MSNCVCWGGRVVPLCPEHGDAKARAGTKVKTRTPAGAIRKTRLSPTSEKQDLRQAYLQGVKDSIITSMIRGGSAAWCEHCEKNVADSLEGARKTLDLHHHDQKRSEAKGYDHKTRKPGADNPMGILLVCRDCHRQLEQR